MELEETAELNPDRKDATFVSVMEEGGEGGDDCVDYVRDEMEIAADRFFTKDGDFEHVGGVAHSNFIACSLQCKSTIPSAFFLMDFISNCFATEYQAQ